MEKLRNISEEGILNVNKPPGITSFDVVRIIRNLFSLRKVGHSGTLDPMAEGVLIILLGKCTKEASYFLSLPKEYVAEMTLGISTDTLDREGKIIEIREVHYDEEKIKKTVGSFCGKIKQTPPMYSALKYQGKKLYELARKGIKVSLSPREIEIYNIEVLSISEDKFPKIKFKTSCSSGTYIRKLAEDIGEKLNCPAHLSALTRTKVGDFKIEDSITLRELELCKTMTKNT